MRKAARAVTGTVVRRALIGAACWTLLTSGCSPALGGKKRPDYPMPPSKSDCALCHEGGTANGVGQLREPLSKLCINCHPDRQAPREHAVDVMPQNPVQGLPLFAGKITCATCHDPHANPYGTLLRKPGTQLCLSCHPY